MRKITTLFIFQLYTQFIFAQFNETIRTGRPGQAIGAFTVGKRVLQFQQGFNYTSLTDVKYKPINLASNNVIRYGILETIELSALIDYEYNHTQFDTTATTLNGIGNIHLGGRVHISNQKGWLPNTGFQVRLKMPKVSADFGANHIAPVMIFIAGWRLPKNMTLGTNWILSFNGNDEIATGRYMVNFGFPIYKKWSSFIENYGQVRQSVFQTRFDGGFAYLLNNNVQLDLSAGYGSNQSIQDYFVSAGISWRIINFRKI